MEYRGTDRQQLKMAILIVNGKFNYKNNLWLKLSVNNIIRYTSPYTKYKVFIWNHDYDNPDVADYLNSVNERVEVINEECFDVKGWSGRLCDPSGYREDCFAGGHHAHRAALQMLYEYVVSSHDADIIFTFDSDSWPIRNNWDIPLVYGLDRDIKLAGIWRDEMEPVIRSYVHPSCLGIKTETIKRHGLRFDDEPVAYKEDTLSHFTRVVHDHYGNDAIMPFRRSNKKQYHPVFNGVYGGYFYHHHLGTRYKDGNIEAAVTYGWQERGDSLEYNKFLLDGTTQMVFERTDDFMDELSYGEKAFNFKLYAAFLKNYEGRDAYRRLFGEAREIKSKDLWQSYYILGLVSKHFADDEEFLRFYADVCRCLGYDFEAKSYMGLLAANNNHSSEEAEKAVAVPSPDESLGLGFSSGDSHYRAYVGPPQQYDLIGAMTFNLLTTIGLRQHHHLLDIGCGSLRSGRLFITYLNSGHYTGIEPNEWLVNEGIRRETGSDLISIKKPHFFFADNAGALPECMTFDFAVAQSVFSHGTLKFIERWLIGLHSHILATGAILATFRQGDKDFYHEQGIQDEDFKGDGWLYPKCPTYRMETIEKLAVCCGYRFMPLDWKHPRQTWAIFARENYESAWFEHKPLTWNTLMRHLAGND
jgi:hypothetical protein